MISGEKEWNFHISWKCSLRNVFTLFHRAATFILKPEIFSWNLNFFTYFSFLKCEYQLSFLLIPGSKMHSLRVTTIFEIRCSNFLIKSKSCFDFTNFSKLRIQIHCFKVYWKSGTCCNVNPFFHQEVFWKHILALATTCSKMLIFKVTVNCNS